MRAERENPVLFLVGLVICLIVATIAICLAVMARSAERNLEATVEDLTGKLTDTLEAKGQLGLLDGVYLSLLDRYQKLGLYPSDDGHDRHLAVLYALVASVHRRHGELKEARSNLERSLAIRKRLCDSNPKAPEYTLDLAWVLDALADVDIDEGRPEEALDRLRESAKYRDELQKNSNDPDRLVAFAATQMRLSDVLRRLGQTDKAQKEFETALNILEQRESDVDTKCSQKLAVAYLDQGDKSRNDGDVLSGLNYYEKSCQVWEDLRNREPSNVGYDASYAVALACLGDAQKEMGELDFANQSYLNACQIRERLFADNEQDVSREAAHAVSLTPLGDVYQCKGDWKNALDNYDKALKHRKELYAKTPGDLNLQADLAGSNRDEGDVLLSQGEPDKALEQYKEALKRWETLAESDPRNFNRKDGLANCYLNLGDAYMAHQGYEQAETYYEKSANLRNELQKKDPTNPARDLHLAVSNAKVAIVRMARSDSVVAAKVESDWNDASQKLLARLDKDSKNVSFAESVAGLCLQFGQLSLKHEGTALSQKAFDLGERLLTEKDKEGRLDFYGAQLLKQLRDQKQALPGKS